MRKFFEVIDQYTKIAGALGIYLFAVLALILSSIESIFKIKKDKPF